MTKIIKYYALEIYTVISMLILVIAGILGDLSIIQKFVLAIFDKTQCFIGYWLFNRCNRDVCLFYHNAKNFNNDDRF